MFFKRVIMFGNVLGAFWSVFKSLGAFGSVCMLLHTSGAY